MNFLLHEYLICHSGLGDFQGVDVDVAKRSANPRDWNRRQGAVQGLFQGIPEDDSRVSEEGTGQETDCQTAAETRVLQKGQGDYCTLM